MKHETLDRANSKTNEIDKLQRVIDWIDDVKRLDNPRNIPYQIDFSREDKVNGKTKVPKDIMMQTIDFVRKKCKEKTIELNNDFDKL